MNNKVNISKESIKDFDKCIENLMVLNYVSNTRMAEILGISVRQLAAVCKGKKRLTVNQLVEAAFFFDISINDFFDGTYVHRDASAEPDNKALLQIVFKRLQLYRWSFKKLNLAIGCYKNDVRCSLLLEDEDGCVECFETIEKVLSGWSNSELIALINEIDALESAFEHQRGLDKNKFFRRHMEDVAQRKNDIFKQNLDYLWGKEPDNIEAYKRILNMEPKDLAHLFDLYSDDLPTEEKQAMNNLMQKGLRAEDIQTLWQTLYDPGFIEAFEMHKASEFGKSSKDKP